MNLIERVKNKIFKCNLSATVEYHAGGFFVKKKVIYLIFTSANNALIYYRDREEGLHPNDNNYELLLREVINENKGVKYKVSLPKANDDFLKLSNNEKELLCMPSIFMENVKMEDLTEIVLDKLDEKTLIFNLVSIIKASAQI